MGNARKNQTKHVYFLEDMVNDDGHVMFEAETAYPVQNNLIENEDLLRVSLDDIWVDFRVEFQPEAE